MFIYHFSRLIKSKLLWGFLALLMVFAFVVVDSCDGAASGGLAQAGFIDGKPVSAKMLENASQTRTILESQTLYYLPQSVQLFGALLRGEDGMSEVWPVRSRQNWKVVAAQRVAERQGIEGSQAAGEAVLERLFADPNGAFNPDLYRAFLDANQYSAPRLFEQTFAQTWLPAQTITLAVFNAVGWASPMEQDFALSAMYDQTVAYAATLKNTLKPEAVEISEADQKAWYDAHKKDYALPEQRVIAYVEVPASAFADKVTVEEMDAMQYYDDHNEEFKGSGTNATQTLPFEEVKDKAVAKVKAQRALESAQTFANETLVAKAHASGAQDRARALEAAAKDYGKPKQATLRADRPFGFQNARDVVASVFEMDAEENYLNAIPGTDRAYLICLQQVIPEHIPAFEEVKARVLADARKDRMEQRLKTNGETIRGLLADSLAKGTAFADAVAACKVEGLSASTAMTFTLSDAANVTIENRGEVFSAAASLGVKALSEPVITPAEDVLIVYVAERKPGDALKKATARPNMARNLAFSSAFQVASDWLEWNLERDAPVNEKGVPVLDPVAAEDAAE